MSTKRKVPAGWRERRGGVCEENMSMQVNATGGAFDRYWSDPLQSAFCTPNIPFPSPSQLFKQENNCSSTIHNVYLRRVAPRLCVDTYFPLFLIHSNQIKSS